MNNNKYIRRSLREIEFNCPDEYFELTVLSPFPTITRMDEVPIAFRNRLHKTIVKYIVGNTLTIDLTRTQTDEFMMDRIAEANKAIMTNTANLGHLWVYANRIDWGGVGYSGCSEIESILYKNTRYLTRIKGMVAGGRLLPVEIDLPEWFDGPDYIFDDDVEKSYLFIVDDKESMRCWYSRALIWASLAKVELVCIWNLFTGIRHSLKLVGDASEMLEEEAW